MPTRSLGRWINDGEGLQAKVKEDGCTVDLQYADNRTPQQISQIRNEIAGGSKILVTAAIDGEALAPVLPEAKKKNATVIAYDRLINGTADVDYYATFDNYKVGQLQDLYIEDQLGLADGKGPVQRRRPLTPQKPDSPDSTRSGELRIYRGSQFCGRRCEHMKTAPGTAPASSNAILRRNNLSTIATLVHRSGPLSRAELTQLTGLNRSAMSVLIGELVDLGWVVEELPKPNGRIGRPSPIVTAGKTYAAVGVHVDTDAIMVGLVGLGGDLLRRIRIDSPTPPTPDDVIRTVGAIVDGFRFERAESRTLVGVGVAVPGLVDATTGEVRWTPKLGWNGVTIAPRLQRALDIPAWVGNGSSLEGLAESRFGAARDINDIVYVAGHASGIGGGVIVGGVPLQGASGYAAELGHTLVRTRGAPCTCGRRGCLEAEVSLDALLAVLGRSTIDQDELDIALGTSRDPRVVAEVARQIDLLSEGLSTFVHLFNPRMVVLGGFLSSLLSAERERLSAEVSSRTLTEFRRGVRIERAALRSRLELIGAAELPLSQALTDPGARGV